MQTAEAATRGPLQLLDAMDAASSVGYTTPTATAMPAGFLERLAERYLEDGLDTIIRPIG